jgi:hypothetical protein
MRLAYDRDMQSYELTRQQYRPKHIKVLLIAESPPPAADVASSRQFYRSDKPRRDDRLFINTIRALYPEISDTPEAELEQEKEQWLRRFQDDGWYMIEALETSLPHEVTKPERQDLIQKHLPRLLARVRELASKDTKIILIKSNVFVVAAEPLCEAGFNVLNKELLDYPGRFNQRAYREKLTGLTRQLK